MIYACIIEEQTLQQNTLQELYLKRTMNVRSRVRLLLRDLSILSLNVNICPYIY